MLQRNFFHSFLGWVILYFLTEFIFCSITSYLILHSFEEGKYNKM
ncbi:hypothetical protein MCORR_v1c06100 [Mesoplasma corruscae]|uniref:Uncharacterized protein n=1 Tax=Mesoplasma corruscae TaxID=216874 RepID=A0A2S5RGQ2_9MOLU|nr:hypothetical protein MCORR_v1c06100 [Mesoplasma corruscae]